MSGGTVHFNSRSGTSPRLSQPVAPLVIPTACVTNASFSAATGLALYTKIIVGTKTRPPPMAVRFPMVAPATPMSTSGQLCARQGARERGRSGGKSPARPA